MNVRFYFDPACPWCWITSFWIADEVAPQRDIDIDWRPISLYVRNEGKLEGEHADVVERTFKLLRVVEALRADGRAHTVRAVYRSFGEHFHHGDDGMDFDVADALEKVGVDRTYADAYDDGSWDDAIRASTREAEEIAGDDVGTPIISFEVDGKWKGYFGPVLPEVVTGDEALKLWDGLRAMIETEGFYELKRTRDIGPQVDTVAIDAASAA